MNPMRRYLPLLLLWCFSPMGLRADAPAFDLAGPKVDVHIKRGAITLPVSQVPNLLAGDRIWVHPDLPESQSAHFVLIVAFLRGATNPPPPEWFTRVETWNKQVRDEGVFVTVPAEAQQALIFLAPETGGDFNTLRAAVRGRPGAFVRATQDLQAASFDRMRLDAYLAEVKATSLTDAKLLKERAENLARTLSLKVDQQCFDKPTDQQAPCLTQQTDGLVLDDANTQSLVTQLANGATGDLMNQLSYSTLVGGGTFSPYVGAILDTARILSSLHTAHFQYIPALALPSRDTLNLRLNTPPSFRDPKSVVVVALPPVGPTHTPPLRPVDPDEKFCASKPGLVLPVDGAPIVFSTQLAYGLTLHLVPDPGGKGAPSSTPAGAPIDLPVTASPADGGLVPSGSMPALSGGGFTAMLRGKWGFDDWEGPHFHLRAPQAGKWTLAAADQSALVVGRDDTLHLEGDSTACVDRIEESTASVKSAKLTWKSSTPEAVEVTLPLKDATPGPVAVAIYQFGLEKPDTLALTAYTEAASLNRLTINAGDPSAVLVGNRLDEVAKADLDGIKLKPAKLSRVEDLDQLAMTAESATTNLDPAKSYTASVELQDGRKLKVPVTVKSARPQVTLLNKGMQPSPTAPASPVHLGSEDDLPVDERLVFFLKSRVPADFPRNEKVEVAADDGGFHTTLSVDDGSLLLEDSKTAMGSVDPLARFGGSAFGPLEVRALSAEGVTGDWLPLGTLVRLPAFKELRCPRTMSKPCTLSGSNLFLATAIGSTPDLANATDVPPDFTGTQLTLPHPTNGIVYLRLRDDPETVQTLTMTVTLVSLLESHAVAAQVPAGAAQPTPATAPAAPEPEEKPDAGTAPKPDASPNR